jgi:hypothetical protein
MLTATVRDLHLTHPGAFVTDVRTNARELWAHNPHITPLSEDDPQIEVIDCDQSLVAYSNSVPCHLLDAFRTCLAQKLGVTIRPHAFHGDIHLSARERNLPPLVDLITGESETPYWIIVSGGKLDYTTKWWDPDQAQEVVNHFHGRLRFVQCGAGRRFDVHPPLQGVVDLVGRTSLRQLVRLMYHARGVVCPITMFVHLAAAVESRPGRSFNRPAVVIAGGREPPNWVSYPQHTVLHTNGCLPCCDHGGCWKARVLSLGDGDPADSNLCLFPTVVPSGRTLPLCMSMIRAGDVIAAVERYLYYDAVYNTISDQISQPAEGTPLRGLLRTRGPGVAPTLIDGPLPHMRSHNDKR